MNTSRNWLLIIGGTALLVSYFLPWVIWDGSKVTGADMALGNFFTVSEAKLFLANPFPKLSFAFYAFWLIPVAAIAVTVAALLNKRAVFLSLILAFLSLSLVSLYVLFTEFGTGTYFGSTTLWIWLHVLGAILVVAGTTTISLLKKLLVLLAGPVIVFASFKLTERYMMAETHQQTADIKAEYTITAPDLIKEFITNDTAANKKYLDKVIQVNGPATSVDMAADSTSTVKFADSTGSYVIFSLDKSEYEQAKQLKAGDEVVLKGVCSGSIFSEILGTTSISFKRALLATKK